MRLLASFCAIALVVAALCSGGCGTGFKCIDVGHSGCFIDSDCCSSLTCRSTDGGITFYCLFPLLTAVPTGE